ncbi:MAG: 4'-phosphopantetheinyl transferase superfamily protein [Myxococcota bacterium]
MTLAWACLGRDEVPPADTWLGAREREILATLTVPKRRGDWLLGRYVAKHALARFEGLVRPKEIDILASNDGAPDVYLGEEKLPIHISISHRDDAGACVLAKGVSVGCDLESIEPRTPRFVADYFTPSERVAVEHASPGDRQRLVALTWSAKESALKVLRVGLRRDTRKVDVRFSRQQAETAGWRALEAYLEPEGVTLHGWWRQRDHQVLTLMSGGRRGARPLSPESERARRRTRSRSQGGNPQE